MLARPRADRHLDPHRSSIYPKMSLPRVGRATRLELLETGLGSRIPRGTPSRKPQVWRTWSSRHRSQARQRREGTHRDRYGHLTQPVSGQGLRRDEEHVPRTVGRRWNLHRDAKTRVRKLVPECRCPAVREPKLIRGRTTAALAGWCVRIERESLDDIPTNWNEIASCLG